MIGWIKEPRTIVAIVIAVLFIGGAIYMSRVGPGRDAGVSSPPQDLSEKRVLVPEGKVPALGRKDAKVVIIEFADFQCPSCAVFQFGAGAVIFEEYVKTGKARFAFKHFPLLGEESFTAAYAAECAEEQGKFWEYLDYLFTRQTQSEGENTGTFSLSNLIQSAPEVGLHKETLADCLRAEKYRQDVLQDLADGRKVGVEGTPTVFVNGRKVAGALPFEAYKKIIEEELK